MFCMKEPMRMPKRSVCFNEKLWKRRVKVLDHKIVSLKTVQETETREGLLAKIILPFISNLQIAVN